jgi:hypothetical protein
MRWPSVPLRANLAGHFNQLLRVSGKLGAGAVDGVALLAGQLDLSSRLERDGRALALESQDVAVLVFGLEAIVGHHPAQQVLDPAGTGVRDCGRVGGADDDLLVLGTDPPLSTGLAAILEIADEILFLFEQLAHQAKSNRDSR